MDGMTRRDALAAAGVALVGTGAVAAQEVQKKEGRGDRDEKSLEQRLKELLRSRKRSDVAVRDGYQEFIVSFTPSGTLRCRISAGEAGQPRPLIFGRGETQSFPAALVASRIIATPEGNPTGIFAAGFNEDVSAQLTVFFFSEGGTSGDTFVYRKEAGTQLQLKLFAVVDGNPTQIFSTTVNDDQEHTTTIQIPA